MAKGAKQGRRASPGAGRKRAPVPVRSSALKRRPSPDVVRVETSRPARSDAARLAVAVERLERELAAARTQMSALAARAEIDPLTDILNRRGFERELKRSLAYVKRYGTDAAVVFVDLDDFKLVNDRHGHAAGDAVLKAVAMVLTRHVRASDLVARLGGDEFAMLLWMCGEADAQAKAQALESAIGRTTATHAGSTLTVGASCGAAMVLPLDHPAELLERADRAMYARKAAKRGQRAAAG
jgi:diguanylate cyclase (GGDEF)-like protein